MSAFIDQAKARALLSNVYVERQEGQWQTVANCLEELIDGTVTELNGLAAVALGVAPRDALAYREMVRRANRLNQRVGKAGAAEVEALARVAIEISASIPKGADLLAHVARIGFNRSIDIALIELVETAMSRTDRSIRNLVRKQPVFVDLADPPDKKNLQESLELRDRYLHEQLLRQDQVHAVTFACLAGQVDPWTAIDEILGPRNRAQPYPFGRELLAAQACLTQVANDSLVSLDGIPILPLAWAAADSMNAPTISAVATMISGTPAPMYVYQLRLPVPPLARQILLEVIYLRRETNA